MSDDDMDVSQASDDMLSSGSFEEDFEDEDSYLGLSQSMEIKRAPSFESLESEQLCSTTNQLIQEVSEILSVPKAIASILLRTYNWNKEVLLNAYTENKEKVLANAKTSEVLEKKPKSKTKKRYHCKICDEEHQGKDTFALSCGHRYCRDCWAGYLVTALSTGPKSSTHTHCPSPGCSSLVHDQAWHDLLPETSLDTYKKFTDITLVTDNPLLKFCPAPGCNLVMKVETRDRTKAVVCKCGFEWCFQCADSDIGDHMPATCEQVALWRERASSESENIKWLAANTKQCPKCRTPIEKNGGCMHLTCRSPGCKYEFCWLCRGDWKEHGTETGGYYSCNKYNSSTAANEDIKSEQIKTELQYYMFYFHRYDSHLQASKIADEQKRKAQERGKYLVENLHVRSQDVNFLVEATQQLVRNRKVLRWSYVYAFYLKTGTKEKNLFEFLQEDLEKYTDQLSKQYERKTDDIPNTAAFDAWKSEVANLIRVTDNFFKKFVQGVQQGLMN